jgi:hypothetical protein
MKEQDIQLKFQSFMQTYASLEIDSSWDKVSLKFRNFWKDKIMNNPEAELSEVEMDEIIRILDRNAKGHIKEDLSVAKVMIPQGVWYRLFRELKSNEILRTKLNKILCEQEDNLLISEIDDLYSFNELVRNSLTEKVEMQLIHYYLLSIQRNIFL